MIIFNIFRKPRVAPPSGLPAPNLDALEPLVKKYESMMDQSRPQWTKVQVAFDNAILLNFDTISYYMERKVYPGLSRHDLEQKVHTSTSYAALCGWVVGKEWGTRYPDLAIRLRNKSRLDTSDIPSDAMELLTKAVYFPYWLFATIFIGYYDSNFGKQVRQQKDAHLKDTYQSLMNGMIMCFLAGIQS